MCDVANLIGGIEASEWFVVFHPTSEIWLARACPGRFKHVSAWGYYAGFKAWLIFDPTWDGLQLRMIMNSEAPTAFAKYSHDCEVIKIARVGKIGLSPLSRLGFWCVPAIKHLLGVRCPTWRPDALYRHLLRRGGVPIGRQTISPGTSSRSEPRD